MNYEEIFKHYAHLDIILEFVIGIPVIIINFLLHINILYLIVGIMPLIFTLATIYLISAKYKVFSTNFALYTFRFSFGFFEILLSFFYFSIHMLSNEVIIYWIVSDVIFTLIYFLGIELIYKKCNPEKIILRNYNQPIYYIGLSILAAIIFFPKLY